MTSRSTFIAAALTISVGAGCGLMIQQMVGRSSTKVEAANPLRAGGGLLEAQAPPANHFVRSYATEGGCDHWPVQDGYAIDVRNDRICVAVLRVSDARPEPGGGSKVEVATDRRTAEVHLSPAGTASRVARCSSQAVSDPFAVWGQAYEGCTANEGLVTVETQRLTIDGDVSWQLAD